MQEDLKAIAKHLMPEANKATVKLLYAIALYLEDYVAGIERIVCRARFFAHRRGEDKATFEDVKRAREEVIPTANNQEKPKTSKRCKRPSRSMRASRNTVSSRLQKSIFLTDSDNISTPSGDRLRPSSSLLNVAESDHEPQTVTTG